MTRAPAALLLALALLLPAACSEDKAPGGDASETEDGEPEGDLDAFWEDEGQPLEERDERARDLPEQLEGATPDQCAAVGAEIDQIARPSEFEELAARTPDPVLREALDEQQVAMASAFAACRGEAPISLADALEELRVSNDALAAVMAARGLR